VEKSKRKEIFKLLQLVIGKFASLESAKGPFK